MMVSDFIVGLYKITSQYQPPTNIYPCEIQQYFSLEVINNKIVYKYYNSEKEIITRGKVDWKNKDVKEIKKTKIVNTKAKFKGSYKSISEGNTFFSKKSIYTLRKGYGNKFGREFESYTSSHEYVFLEDQNKVLYTGNYYFSNGDFVTGFFEKISNCTNIN